jgi:transcriptional regulator with XRE-family HTH domain
MPRPSQDGRAAVGRAVRVRRAELAWTQEELAREAGVNVDTVSDLEAGNTWPRTRTLRAIEQALTLERGELDRVAHNPEPSVIPPDLLAEIRKTLPPHEQPGVIAAIERELRGEPVTPPGTGEEASSPAERRAAG